VQSVTRNGKVAVVTGGGGGIGRTTALKLAQDGAAVAIWDIELSGGQETARLIEEQGGRACAFQVDVAEPAEVARAAAQSREEVGPITILVNNASHFGFSPFEDLTLEAWDRMCNVDLRGAFLCIKSVLSDMLQAGWGRIINITSSAAHLGTPNMAHYVASKNGLIGLTRALAIEFAPRGVTANNVAPGYIEGPRLRRNQRTYAGGEVKNSEQSFPMKRAGRPEEVAAAIAYLVSERANYVTGQTISVTGGRNMI
jgi:2-hydroxycyclohexanecarboxyl-CoA dehydrogenase